MMTTFMRNRLMAAAVAAAAVSAFAPSASAATCASLPSPVYMTGSSAVKPFAAKLGTALGTATPATTVVYKGQGSCFGPDAIYNGTAMTGTASFWDATGMEQSCDLDLTGTPADVGVSDVYGKTCNAAFDKPDVGDFFGPVQVMNFVVPAASSQTSISAEAAYLVFGFGMAGAVAPYTDDNLIFRRNETSGTQLMITTALSQGGQPFPGTKWKGIDATGSGALLTKVSTSAMPEATIGILASDLADDAVTGGKIKILQYQHYEQSCGFLPDSSTTSHDKKNVRDGHYPIWGPLHMFAKIGADKKPTNKAAATLIDAITGAAEVTGVNMIDVEISAHTIPGCAMQVGRTAEIGALMSVAPAKPCGCYFEAKANGAAPTSCKTCTTDTDCAGGPATHCRYGYCEAS